MPGGSTNLQTAQDGYAYWSFPKSVYVTLNVYNNPVDVAFGTTLGAGGPEAASYTPTDEYLTPGTLIRPDRFDAIRIKNHTPGKVAQYSIAVRLANDLAPGVELGASFTPSFIVLNPDGTIGADFTGHVHAQGLDLDAGSTSTPPDQDRVRWIRQSDGSVVADLFGYSAGGIDELVLQAYSLGVTDSAGAQLAVRDHLGNLAANVSTSVNDGAVPFGAVTAGAEGTPTVTVIDSNGVSSFLRHAELFSVQSVSLTFTASAKATEQTVVHNLGSIPTSILVTPIGDPGVVLAPYAKNLGSTTSANIGAYTTAAISANKPVTVWIFK